MAIDDFTFEGSANLPIQPSVIAATNSNSSKDNAKIIIEGNITPSYINILTPPALLHKQINASIINSSGAIVQTFNITNASTIKPVNKLGTGFYFAKFMQSALVIMEESFNKH